MTQSHGKDRAGLTRRRFLKTTAAATGAAAGTSSTMPRTAARSAHVVA